MKLKRLKSRTKYILIFGLGFLFSIGSIFSIVKNYYYVYKLSKYRDKLQRENELLKSSINLYNKNDFIEYNARVRLGFKKEDEIEYRFTPPKK